MNKSLKQYYKITNKILSYEKKLNQLTNEELRSKTKEFKRQIQEGVSLDRILPEAYAVVREASKRVLKMEHFETQLIGGIALHKGDIAEQKTGEGKTLVSTCPAYLNALTGKSVLIVTVNDYLAKRDAKQMGHVHEYLGLTVGVILNEMSSEERKKAYACDITYVTNNELGFDYLRDNMVLYKEQQVLRGLDYCIIDEVDSILIDEARTPLIISGQRNRSTSLYVAADYLAKKMVAGQTSEYRTFDLISDIDINEAGEFILDEIDRNVYMTSKGIKQVEDFFHVNNLSDPDNIDILRHMTLALKANYLMHPNKDYVVKDDEILIVDEFTGRTMQGRRYSDGLHQAIEAKEGVEIMKESKTLATITYQSLFNKFEKKAGMTGTAKTEEKEFRDTYQMDVIQVPTNKPVIRNDVSTLVFPTKKEKFQAIIDEIEKTYHLRQPILVGTATIRTSELLSKMLQVREIPHCVLNAKNVESEAIIVEKAGMSGAVTIATNMAGRGTDIKLDEKAKELGGLKIIGTELHESRRIDNQLRGRAGRQGDPGESCFYVSLEDDLIKHYASEKHLFKQIKKKGNYQHKLLVKKVEAAQIKVEHNNFGIRGNLLRYDETNNEQREIIYRERNFLLHTDSIKEIILNMIRDTIYDTYENSTFDENIENKTEQFLLTLNEYIPLNIDMNQLLSLKKKELLKYLVCYTEDLYKEKESSFEDEQEVRAWEHRVLLKIMDICWTEHLEKMDKLKESISLQSYAQHDPVIEYKLRSYQMFNEMLNTIRKMTVKAITHM